MQNIRKALCYVVHSNISRDRQPIFIEFMSVRVFAEKQQQQQRKPMILARCNEMGGITLHVAAQTARFGSSIWCM